MGSPSVKAEYGLSPMQSGMLFEALLHAEHGPDGGYNIEQLHVELSERVDPQVFGRAFSRVAARHAPLASTFHWPEGGKPVQRVHLDVVVPVELATLEGETQAARARSLDEFLRADRARGFDLAAAPLMRVTFLTTSTGEHSLVWTFHHLLLDGRAFALVLREVFSEYAADRRSGPPPPPSAAGRSYADFIAWLATRDPSAGAAHFETLLAGKLTPTPLPLAEPLQRPLPVSGYEHHELAFSPSAHAKLQMLASETETSVGSVVQAAWALVLGRYTREHDVVFGAPRACRGSALSGAARDMIGLFMNTLPVRAKLDDELRVRELLGALRAQSHALRPHEHTPLVDVQRASRMPRGTPLYETLLMFDNRALDDTLEASGWLGTHSTLYEQPSTPLTLIVVEGSRLEARMLYDRKRFTPSAIARLGRSFAHTLEALAEDPERRLGELEVIDAEEREKILVRWNDTARPFPEQLRIHELFEARVREQPTAAALELRGRTLTYAELEASANRIANLLRARGVQPNDYVGVCLDRGFDLVAALLGVVKAGAAYVPLDPEHPAERLSFMLSDAAARVTLTQQKHASLFTGRTGLPSLLVMDGRDAEALEASSPAALPASAQPSDVCYAIFTSGSTGQPKGVVLTHRAVVNTLDWVTRTQEIGPGDRLLFVTSPCFDLSVYDTFGVLGAGATVVIADEALLADPAELAAAIASERISVWDSAPAALQRLVPFFPKRDERHALRRVLLSGDWIPLTLPGAVRAAFPRAQVTSLGGATEAAIWSNFFPVGELDPRWPSVPYGKPIQNARYHVLDERLQPVPVGVMGDLYIGGTCLAQGYLNRAELTAERFIADPFARSERLYKTGDLARYWDDGNLEFLGRADFQVKIRGYRVELGEVEYALGRLENVREAVCTAFLDGSGQKSLVAYVVPKAGVSREAAFGSSRSGAKLDAEAIKAAIAARLPEYMVPSVVIVLDTMPLSANGKVDRKALPSPSQLEKGERYVAPRTAREQALVEIWQDVLAKRPIGVRDDFFELGGHSMLAVTLMTEMKQRLGLDVPLSQILRSPTIELLAKNDSADAAGPAPLVTALRVAPRASKNLFLVHDGDGETLLYLNLAKQLEPDVSVYGINPLRKPGIAIAHTCIRDMAACYIEQARKLQPHGPYYLGGLCAGGVIAFEMARQLTRANEVVELVVLLDAVESTTTPIPFHNTRRRLRRLVRRLRKTESGSVHPSSSPPRPSMPPPLANDGRPRAVRVAEATLRAARNALEYEIAARRHAASVRERIEIFRRVMREDRAWPRDVPPLAAREIYTALRDAYVPEITNVKHTVLVKASSGTGADEAARHAIEDPLLGWGRYIRGDIRVVDAPGGHSSMLYESQVAFIATLLAPFLSL